MPHRKIPLRGQRMAIAQVTLDFARVATRGTGNTDDERFGNRTPEVLVTAALIIGTCEGRALSVSKIADMTGMSRNTCQRRLEDLCTAGIAKRNSRGFLVTNDALSSEEAVERVKKLGQIILDAAAKLSKMDTNTVAAREVNK